MIEWSSVAVPLANGDQLSYNQSRMMMRSIMSGSMDEIHLAAFLSLLTSRGVAVAELRGLADEMRDAAQQVDLPQTVVDIVGTGGDRANTVNISTMASLVARGLDLPVVKHGNRASTSASGSADVLEALGVNLELTPRQIEAVFKKTGIAFLFANKFHPSMRHAARVRRELGFPTVFNVLGPLTNPARPSVSVVGVANPSVARLVAGVFAERNTRAFVFRGAELGLDELSTVEPARIWEVRDGAIEERVVDPAAILGAPRADIEDLRGGTPELNAQIARSVLSGADGPVADAVALNASLALMAASTDKGQQPFEGRLVEAFSASKRVLSSGVALQRLDEWIAQTNRELV